MKTLLRINQTSDVPSRADRVARQAQNGPPEYSREQELVTWAGVAVLLVISAIASYILWARVNGWF
jgi:hypothetical protein